MRQAFVKCVSRHMAQADACALCFLHDEADVILSGHLLPAASDDIDVLLLHVGAQGTIYQISDLCAERLGISREQAIGTSLFDYLPPHVKIRSMAMLSQALRTGRPVEAFGFDLGHWFQALYIPTTGPGYEGLCLIIRKETHPQERQFVEVLPNGEKVKL